MLRTLTTAVDIAGSYQDVRRRIIELVSALDEQDVPVAACPAWSVRDVLAHLAAVAQDWSSGEFSRPPTDEETAAQVARFDGQQVPDICSAWTAAAAKLEELAATRGLVAPIEDVTSHEHDIRTAIGRPGARDSAAVWYSADQVLRIVETTQPLRVAVEDADYRSGPADGDEIMLRTTRFEALRWRTGRRSRAQLLAMDWSADPTPLLGDLCLFGPAETDIVE